VFTVYLHKGGRWTREDLVNMAFNFLVFGLLRVMNSGLYQLQARCFGTGRSLGTLALKTFVDLRTALSAKGTRSPTGAKMMAAWSNSGGISSDPPAHVAPRRRAKVWVATSPGRVKVSTDRPCHFATCATIWAAAPKP